MTFVVIVCAASILASPIWLTLAHGLRRSR